MMTKLQKLIGIIDIEVFTAATLAMVFLYLVLLRIFDYREIRDKTLTLSI